MNVALFATGRAPIARLFLERHQQALLRDGICVRLLVIDDGDNRNASRLKRLAKVAKRQAHVAGCSTLHAAIKILTYKALQRAAAGRQAPPPTVSADLDIVHVPNLNHETAIEAVRTQNIDLICLMGTRIILKRTLIALSTPMLNIHSSDPCFVRGGPPVFWEVLSGKDDMVLTIHDVEPELDTGQILRQQEIPIRYFNSLGRTLHETMGAARPAIANLYRDAILDIHRDTVQRKPNARGPLRVTPGVFQMIKAQLICWRKHGESFGKV